MLRRCTSLSDWKETERFRDVRVELSRLRSMLYLDTMRAAVRDDDEDHQATTVPDTKLIPKAFPMCEDTTHPLPHFVCWTLRMFETIFQIPCEPHFESFDRAWRML